MPIQHYTIDSYRAGNSVGYLVRRSTSLLIECLEPAVTRHGFTFTQWMILMHLRDGLAHNASGICSLLRHDSGSLTRVIDLLESRGLIERQRSLEDRRAVGLRLTAEGSRMLEATLLALVERMNFALRDFSPDEFSELKRLLNKLIGSLDSTSAEKKEPATTI